ncbi:hypothetical protein BCR33DRAFT_734872 [Rhizoclosmatium globosum]|uniref:PARP n=1 Tax=Rhizoclosmatium globosum TaxID=329046 RepID=A0A1Y2CQR8_9FUNG|nr:hypothetical protein BCR33DRAFT_734872 [Rhizoclosmatium globosum]|eukprot:ORY49378.1 hypothetical protein BCR33DRAFT_734872 [Rhizoclosmatium globosum]
MGNVTVSEGGLCITQTSHHMDLVKTTSGIDLPLPNKEILLFGFQVIDTGRGEAISFGLCPANYSSNDHLGWRQGSVGYHSDDGKVFYNSNSFDVGYVWKRGDEIKAIVTAKSISFYHDGDLIQTISMAPGYYYFAISFESYNARILLNRNNSRKIALPSPTQSVADKQITGFLKIAAYICSDCFTIDFPWLIIDYKVNNFARTLSNTRNLPASNLASNSTSDLAEMLIRLLAASEKPAIGSLSKTAPSLSNTSPSKLQPSHSSRSKSSHQIANSIQPNVHQIQTVADSKAIQMIISQTRITVLICMTTWCRPCSVFQRHINEISKNYLSVRFLGCYLDNQIDPWFHQWDISCYPTSIVFHGGAEYDRVSGGYVHQMTYILSTLTQPASLSEVAVSAHRTRQTYFYRPGSSEINTVSNAFHSSNKNQYPNLTFTILEVQGVENPKLLDQFKQCQAKLGCQPVVSYHGTREENINGIRDNGFLTSHIGKTDDGFFGRGFYVSPNADYAVPYSHADSPGPIKAGQIGFIFVCHVLLGKTYRVSDQDNGRKIERGYDSHESPRKCEFVVFRQDQIRPVYVIKFKAEPSIRAQGILKQHEEGENWEPTQLEKIKQLESDCSKLVDGANWKRKFETLSFTLTFDSRNNIMPGEWATMIHKLEKVIEEADAIQSNDKMVKDARKALIKRVQGFQSHMDTLQQKLIVDDNMDNVPEADDYDESEEVVSGNNSEAESTFINDEDSLSFNSEISDSDYESNSAKQYSPTSESIQMHPLQLEYESIIGNSDGASAIKALSRRLIFNSDGKLALDVAANSDWLKIQRSLNNLSPKVDSLPRDVRKNLSTLITGNLELMDKQFDEIKGEKLRQDLHAKLL